MIDLSEQLPLAQLDGFDISDSQFPPQQWLPNNVKLRTHDALAEVPNELVEKYDVIHLGLLVLVAGDNPTNLLNNAVKMLSTYLDLRLNSCLENISKTTDYSEEPGGYLQWDEADLGGLKRETVNSSASKDKLDELYQLMEQRFNPKGLSYR